MFSGPTATQMKTMNPRLARRTSAAMTPARTASSPPSAGEADADPRRAPQLVDGHHACRRIGAPRLETLHVEPEADRRERDAEQEALELAVGMVAETLGRGAGHVKRVPANPTRRSPQSA
jgi:hypothetical protein